MENRAKDMCVFPMQHPWSRLIGGWTGSSGLWKVLCKYTGKCLNFTRAPDRYGRVLYLLYTHDLFHALEFEISDVSEAADVFKAVKDFIQ